MSFKVPNWLKDGESLSLLETEKTGSKRNNKLYEGFSFRVMRFPIVFEGLGILTSALSAFQNLANLTVEVRDRVTEEVVNSVTFNTTDLAAGPSKLTASGFTFKLLNEKNLPTVEFDGVLSLRADGGRKADMQMMVDNALQWLTIFCNIWLHQAKVEKSLLLLSHFKNSLIHLLYCRNRNPKIWMLQEITTLNKYCTH